MATKKKLLEAAAGAAGGAALNVESVFSTYLYEGNGSSQVIENGINLGQSYGSGSANFNGTDQRIDIPSATNLQIGSADFTLEMFFFLKEDAAVYDILAIKGFNSQNSREYGFEFVGGGAIYYLYSTNGSGWQLPQVVTSGVTVGEWHHIAVSRDGSNLSVWFNGTRTYNDTNHPLTYHTGTDNFQIAGYDDGSTNALYSPAYFSNLRLVKGSVVYNPTSTSITVPTSELTNVTNTSLLTLQGSSPFTDNSSSGHSAVPYGSPSASTFGPFDAAEAGEGGLVWAKQRTGSSSQHALFDTENGTLKALASSSTAALATEASVTSFNANGFSLGNFNNTSGQDYASWTFRKAPKFFDVVTYTGNSTAGRTISHNLGTTVGSIIIKRTDTTSSWVVYHRGNTAAPETDYLTLNTTDATSDLASIWFDTAPTDTEFTLGDQIWVNASGGTYVAYLFAHNDGDGEFGPDGDADIIKCGSFTGNGSSDGPEIDLGFEPQWVLLKDATNGSTNWNMHDNMRGITVGGADAILYANQNFAENASIARMDITPTGFKMRTSTTGWNASSANMIYIAIRRGPMAVPESATDVFDVNAITGNGTSDRAINTGFVTDVHLSMRRSSNYPTIVDRLRGHGSGRTKRLATHVTNAEQSLTGNYWLGLDTNDGYILSSDYENQSSQTYVQYAWKRAPSHFDAVAYTGTGLSNVNTISHNLGVAPEMIWTKRRDSTNDWQVYHSGLNGGTTPEQYSISLNTTLNEQNRTYWNDTAPTSTTFQVTDAINGNGDPYIAYLFASLDGVSKVGSYTGDGTTGRVIDCGFSSGARFVMVRTYTLADNWWIFDTERGIVAGNDPRLYLNTTDAEATTADLVDPHSSGFIVNSVNGEMNYSGRGYIFYAIA